MAYNVAFRFGKMTKLVEERLGKCSAEVLRKVSTLGHARVCDLEELYNFSEGKGTQAAESSDNEAETMVNGADGEHLHVEQEVKETATQVKSANQLHQTLDNLLHSGFLCLVTEQAYMTEYDVHIKAEQTAMRDGGYRELSELKGSKEKKAFRESVDILKRKWRNDSHIYASKSGESRSKRRRTAFLVSNGLNPRTQNDEDLDDGFRIEVGG
jgi:hypothetical protein